METLVLRKPSDHFGINMPALDTFKEVLPAIMKTKERIVNDDNENSYNSWLVNKAMSYFPDTIFYANEANRLYSSMPKQAQFDLYLAVVKPKYRQYTKWPKLEADEVIDALMELNGFSRKKASAAARVLNMSQIEALMKTLDKGGTAK